MKEEEEEKAEEVVAEEEDEVFTLSYYTSGSDGYFMLVYGLPTLN